MSELLGGAAKAIPVNFWNHSCNEILVELNLAHLKIIFSCTITQSRLSTWCRADLDIPGLDCKGVAGGHRLHALGGQHVVRQQLHIVLLCNCKNHWKEETERDHSSQCCFRKATKMLFFPRLPCKFGPVGLPLHLKLCKHTVFVLF